MRCARAVAAAPAISRSQDASRQVDGLSEAGVHHGGVVRLLPGRVEAADDAAHTHRRDVLDERRGDRLTGVVGVDALHQGVVDERGDARVIAAGPRTELTPDEAERGVADAVRALARATALVVVEVPGRRVVGVTDVDAEIGRGQKLLVAGPHDVEVVMDETQDGDREDLVGVEGARVGGDAHGRQGRDRAARGERGRTLR